MREDVRVELECENSDTTITHRNSVCQGHITRLNELHKYFTEHMKQYRFRSSIVTATTADATLAIGTRAWMSFSITSETCYVNGWNDRTIDRTIERTNECIYVCMYSVYVCMYE